MRLFSVEEEMQWQYNGQQERTDDRHDPQIQPDKLQQRPAVQTRQTDFILGRRVPNLPDEIDPGKTRRHLQMHVLCGIVLHFTERGPPVVDLWESHVEHREDQENACAASTTNQQRCVQSLHISVSVQGHTHHLSWLFEDFLPFRYRRAVGRSRGIR
eukprot:Skav211499  [mRNA]  locus=scaffold2188:822519:829246:- [translate_table: standard]